jgi:hypothetical protein
MSVIDVTTTLEITNVLEYQNGLITRTKREKKCLIHTQPWISSISYYPHMPVMWKCECVAVQLWLIGCRWTHTELTETAFLIVVQCNLNPSTNGLFVMLHQMLQLIILCQITKRIFSDRGADQVRVGVCATTISNFVLQHFQ